MIEAANAAGLDLAGTAPAHPGPVRDPAGFPRCTAFHGPRLLASGFLDDILPALKVAHERDLDLPLLVFEDSSGRLVDLELRGTLDEALRRLQPAAPAVDGRAGAAESAAEAGGGSAAPSTRAAGRPRLGVVAREVTLLPRHWEWLGRQPGGASVTLRRLVDEARKSGGGRDRVRQAQEVAYRFLLAMGGDLPGYEEALRALFAGKRERFAALLAHWPADVRDHALRLAAGAFPGEAAPGTAAGEAP